MFKEVLGFFSIVRFYRSFIASILVFLLTKSIIYSLAFLFFLFFSFVFNNWIDFEQDRKHHKKRVKKYSILSKKQITFFMILNFLGTIGFAHFLEFKLFILYLVALFSSIFYSGFFKKTFPSIAIRLWCLLCVVLVLYPLNANFYQYGLVFSFFYFRELLLDERDFKNDDKFCETKSLKSVLENQYILYSLFFGILIFVFAFLLNNLYFITSSIMILGLYGFYLFNGMNKEKAQELANIYFIFFPLILLI